MTKNKYVDAQVADWLTPAQACDILGVEKRSLIRWEKQGIVEMYRTPGGHRRYKRADIEGILGKVITNPIKLPPKPTGEQVGWMCAHRMVTGHLDSRPSYGCGCIMAPIYG